MRLISMCCVLLLLWPQLAGASAESSANSGDSSQTSGASDSGASSGDSGASSRESGESSNVSAESSQTSADSSEQSDSSQQTSQNSGEASVVVIGVGSAILLVGGSVFLGILAVQASAGGINRVADAELLRFLKENHALVSREVLEGEGRILEGWYSNLTLSEEERSRMRSVFDASEAQSAMLSSLASLDSTDDARAFAEAFVSLLQEAIGAPRVEFLVRAATRS